MFPSLPVSVTQTVKTNVSLLCQRVTIVRSRYLEQLVEEGRLDETATLLRCLRRLATKADVKFTRNGAESGADEPKRGGVSWVRGFTAVLEAVQDLVRRLKGGATLSIVG